MPYNTELVEEINLLTRFDLDTNQAGIKVHSSADASLVKATQRLFDKGLVSQVDGGYLTILGRTAAEHAQDLLQILK